MHLSVYEQGEIFRCAFLFGVCLGAFYDVFRLLRALGSDSDKAVFVQDIVFCCCCSVACFLFAQTTVHGHFRFFVMAAHFLGLIAYRASVGILTGRVYKAAGVCFKYLLGLLNKAVICFSCALRRISANISRSVRKIHVCRPVGDKRGEKKRASARFFKRCIISSKKI